MRKLTLLFFAVATTLTFGQDKNPVTFQVKSGVSSEEFQNYLSFKNVGYYNILFKGNALKGKKFIIVAKEYWDKEVRRTDTVADLALTPIPGLPADSLSITIITEKNGSDSLTTSFMFKNLFGVIKKYPIMPSDLYSTRNLSDGRPVNIETGAYFPLLVHTLPYTNPQGWLMYCKLSNEGVPPAEWGEKYNIPHYIVFEMKLY